MQIAAHMLAFGVDRYVEESITALAPHVDKIFVAYPDRPFGYNAGARLERSNPTPRSLLTSLDTDTKIEIVDGSWDTEEETRNACLERAETQGFDWLLIVDADEFYTLEAWSQIKRALRSNPTSRHLTTTWYNFFKSSHFAIVDRSGNLKTLNAGFAVRCQRRIRFTDKRHTNAASTQVLDCPCFHYGYVMSNEEMLSKISTWGHTNDFDCNRWYRIKWSRWTPATKNLHPTNPIAWKQARRFPLQQPDFAHKFALPVDCSPSRSKSNVLEELAYDTWAEAKHQSRSFRKFLRQS